MVYTNTIGEVMKSLDSSREDVLELIRTGDLDKVDIPQGSVAISKEDGNKLPKNAFLISQKSIINLFRNLYSENELKLDFFHNNLVDLRFMLEELARFDEGYRKRKEKTRLSKIKNPENDRETIYFSKKQVDTLFKGVPEEAFTKAGLGACIMAADEKFHPKPNGETIDDVITSLGLNINDTNKERILSYYLCESGKEHKENVPPVLNMVDYGKIALFLDESPLDGIQKRSAYANLLKLYLEEYTKDEILRDFNIKKDRDDLRFLEGGIDLRTSRKNIENFKKITITPLHLSRILFNPHTYNYFLKKGEDFDLTKLIKEEALIYAEEKLKLLEPFMIDGHRKYDQTDADFFRVILEGKGIFHNLSLGIEMKVGFESYKSDSRKDVKGLTIKQAAAELGTTPERAKELGIFVDVGFISEFAKKTGRGYDGVEEFYNKYFKDKVEGFSDETVRDFRVDRSSLDTFIGRLKKAPFNLEKANEELRRQYKIDSKKGVLLDIPEPFNVDGKVLYSSEAMAKIIELVKNG